jgi:cyclopropane-fatty-acyl-phospholipid synthase
LSFARERIEKAGLSDRVEFRLQDYRDELGTYDGIASIEMSEAVGERYWPIYFDTLRDRLRPGARAALQVITVGDDRFESYRKEVDFIQKYIFPGGMLPSSAKLREQADRSGLEVEGQIEFGESYSLTLRRWFERFNEKWADVAALGFDDRFRRMWNFYLTSCASAFMVGNCNVVQITIAKPR